MSGDDHGPDGGSASLMILAVWRALGCPTSTSRTRPKQFRLATLPRVRRAYGGVGGRLTSAASVLLMACSIPVPIASPITCAELERSAPPVTIERSYSAPPGALFLVSLCANPITGFMWQPSQIDDPALVCEIERCYAPPAEQQPGAAGTQILVFEAGRVGSARITLNYSQPWPGGLQASWRLTLAVSITW